MYPKFTCSCRVELSIGNEHVFCSRREYFSADSNSTYKTFLCSSIKRTPPQKKMQWISKVLQYLQLNYICHAFSIQQAAMFAYGSIEDHMFNFITGFFSTSLEMFLNLVLGFLRIIHLFSNFKLGEWRLDQNLKKPCFNFLQSAFKSILVETTLIFLPPKRWKRH